MSDPIDTLVVVGGTSVTGVDAATVREAAARMGHAAGRLEAAAFRATQAARGFDGAAFTAGPASIESTPNGSLGGPGSLGGLGADAVPTRCVASPASCYGTLADDARHHARRLRELAQQCTTLRDRLLRAAGLYEYTESATEHLIGAGVGAAAAAVGVAVSTPAGQAAIAVDAVVLGMIGWQFHRTTGGATTVAAKVVGARVARETLRTLAPYTDEAVQGLAVGITAAHPFASGYDFSVQGAATTLSRLVALLLPETTATVTEVRSDALTRSGSGTIRTALVNLDKLYAHGQEEWPDLPTGAGGPGGGPGAVDMDGVPAATISVEKVTHDDGTVSWVVLIPGTEELLSGTNPLDGRSDLEIMARDGAVTADAAAAVEAALAEAGVGSDEPVVLVGHSLGGLAAAALADSASFRSRYRIGGIVTAGSPTASFTTPKGVPVLELSDDEGLVANTDGRSGAESPSTPDRVTVSRRLAASDDPTDQQASQSTATAHGDPTQIRTYDLARESGNVQVEGIVDRIEPLMSGSSSEVRYFAASRVAEP